MTRTAEEWGRVAVGLPGWRWMPGVQWAALRAAPLDAVTGRMDDRTRTMYAGWAPYPGAAPDPDDPATAGCLLALLGSGVRVWMDVDDGLWTVEVGGVRASMHATLGRACIADAAAIGRWPGGGA